MLLPLLKSLPTDPHFMKYALLSSQPTTAGVNVVISVPTIVDEATLGFYNVTIEAGAALTFDPTQELEFRAANILVSGRLEIGSETCPYKGRLTITLTGDETCFLIF